MNRRLLPQEAILLAPVIIVGGLIFAAMLTDSCTSACGLRLWSRVSLSSTPLKPSDPPNPVPCCGGFLFQDVNLRATDIQQVDLSNSQVSSGHVDGFLTAPDCTRLFDGPYTGTVAQALCKIYIGPVAAGTVSQRQTVPNGAYRVFAQAWTSNETSELFGIDVGIYSDKCQPVLLSPSQ
jgi:hypothetical protein